MIVVKAKVRAEIIAEARSVFTRFGFRKATMEEVARATGMGKSSIYYYFKSKEEIFKAVVESEADELKTELDRAIDRDKSAIEKMKDYIFFRMHHLRTVSNFYAALKEENLAQMDFILRIRKKFDQDELRIVKGILVKGMKDGDFKLTNPDIGAIAITTMMKGLELPLFLDIKKKADREKLLDDLIKVLFFGIIKRE